MKKIITILLAAAMLFTRALSLTGCNGESENGPPSRNDGGLSRLNLVSEYGRHLEGTTLNIINWGEFIAEGPDLHVVRAFQELTGIRVNYATFSTNEELHLRLTSGGAAFDLTFPSDYMIQRLIAEDELYPINFENIPNFQFVEEAFRNLFFDPEGIYSVPYVYGMVGLIYNSELVYESPTSWGALWDERYDGQILQFQSSRDAFALAQFMLGIDLNTTDPDDWYAAAEKLMAQAPLVQAYVADEIYAIMEGSNAFVGPYYMGDFLLMQEINPALRFVYPEEGTNRFYDSMVIPRSAQNREGAEMFINFMLEPDVVLANANAVPYRFPHTEINDHPDYIWRGNEILFPDEDSLPPLQSFEHLPAEIIALKNRLWNEVWLS